MTSVVPFLRVADAEASADIPYGIGITGGIITGTLMDAQGNILGGTHESRSLVEPMVHPGRLHGNAKGRALNMR